MCHILIPNSNADNLPNTEANNNAPVQQSCLLPYLLIVGHHRATGVQLLKWTRRQLLPMVFIRSMEAIMTSCWRPAFFAPRFEACMYVPCMHAYNKSLITSA